MKIEVYFDSQKSRDEFMDNPPPEGINCYFEASNSKGGDIIYMVFLEISKGISEVGIGVFSSWLYDKIKGKPAKIKYKRKEVICERIEIIRIIEKHITIEEESSEED